MVKHLVVVESPAKAKTINKYLGRDFHVLASYGHVRDLLPKGGAVEPDNDFAMHYVAIPKNAKHMEAIAQAMVKADDLYLATDPDREGEAIAWHIQEIISKKRDLKNKPVHRVVFHEITKNAIQHAVQNPRAVSMFLVNAQQARRALDYLVGFNLSPLLWRKVRRGLSAGRVQSPALRLIVEREQEIEKFITQEYWTVLATLLHPQQSIQAKLIVHAAKKLEQFSITTGIQAQAIVDEITRAAGGVVKVIKVDKKQRKRNPAAPFITSTLQQEAARRCGFSAQKTMRVAQQLYEGIDTGDGSIGLITYMRTDSVNLANEAISELREIIVQLYGSKALPADPQIFTTKSKNAQEAHEAIRPTSAQHMPQNLVGKLSDDQWKLYNLIWQRTVACQMIPATIATVAIDFACGNADHVLRANGATVIVPGFMQVYTEQKDDQRADDEANHTLPPVTVGDILPMQTIAPYQHFTEPPPRYGEAALIKALEEHGIGRPSTYASIITTLQNREYVNFEKKRFIPTDVGRIVNKFLTEHFTQYVDYGFTAQLEDQLDAISRGETEWIPVLREFWQPFHQQVDHVLATVKRSDVTQEKIDEVCPTCSKALAIRLGKRGRFIGCTGYPDCAYTRNLQSDAGTQPEVLDRTCPECAAPLQMRVGKYGKFIGCSAYPKCKYLEPLNKPEDTHVTCPKCNSGTMLKKQSRKGKIFYACATYPKCNYAVWYQPIAEACPMCDWPILLKKITKRFGAEIICEQPNCGYKEKITDEESST